MAQVFIMFKKLQNQQQHNTEGLNTSQKLCRVQNTIKANNWQKNGALMFKK